MKLATLKPWALRQQRQERWRRDRAAVPTLRGGYPRVERLRIDLTFIDGEAYVPAAQSHILHPAAQAFFSFPCPYADCDGRYDLHSAVSALLKESADGGEGKLVCPGNRARDGKGEQPCLLPMQFTVSVQYELDAVAQS